MSGVRNVHLALAELVSPLIICLEGQDPGVIYDPMDDVRGFGVGTTIVVVAMVGVGRR